MGYVIIGMYSGMKAETISIHAQYVTEKRRSTVRIAERIKQ